MRDTGSPASRRSRCSPARRSASPSALRFGSPIAAARSSRSASSTSTLASSAALATPAFMRREQNSTMRASAVSAAIAVAAGEQFGVMLGDQRLDQLLEARALHHQVELVERQIDPVIGDPSLRKIIRPDALRPVARADLPAPHGGAFLIEPLALALIEFGPQNFERLGLVLVLRLLVLLADHDAARQMRDAHRAVRGVDRLATRPRRA